MSKTFGIKCVNHKYKKYFCKMGSYKKCVYCGKLKEVKEVQGIVEMSACDGCKKEYCKVIINNHIEHISDMVQEVQDETKRIS